MVTGADQETNGLCESKADMYYERNDGFYSKYRDATKTGRGK